MSPLDFVCKLTRAFLGRYEVLFDYRLSEIAAAVWSMDRNARIQMLTRSSGRRFLSLHLED